MTLSVLFVCSGNICRSPFAELYLRSALSDLDAIVVTTASAGTIARDGDVMPTEMRSYLDDFGIDSSGHRSRHLTEAYVRSADLILALSRDHRSDLVRMVPRKLFSTYTLREFARLGDSATDEELKAAAMPAVDMAERVRALGRFLASRRPLASNFKLEDDDVRDPYRQGRAAYDESVEQLLPALQSTARVLRLALNQ